MPPLAAAEVFTPTSFPTYTYVPRDELHHERLLRQWMASPTQLASIAGPSKAGKTVLVQRVVGAGLVTVSGASVRAADQLWERVLDWLGEPHATTASRSDGETQGTSHDRSASAGLAGLGVQLKGGGSVATTRGDALSATANRRGLPQVVGELAGTAQALLLDDFHYIPAAIQADVAQQLKDAAARGVRICVASVPHRADNVVRALPELRGRVLAVDLDYWSRRDLLEIPRLGFARLGLALDADSLARFATEAAGSPQLMQSICLWACNDLGVHAALPAPRAVALDDAARRRILFLTSCSVDYRSLAGALAAGARARGGERKAYRHVDGGRGDVYLTVMRAVALDPPRLALPYAELGERLRALCDGEVPDGASVVRALVHAGQVAAATTPGAPPLEWDEDAQTLVLADPYLLFYLRWSGFLVRAAGDDA